MAQNVSSLGPTPLEAAHDKVLEQWAASVVEPLEMSERRRLVLEKLRDICKKWIRTTYITEFNLPPNEDVGGRIFTTGSYRLNVHLKGSDIDVVVLTPQRMTREHFFSTLMQRLQEQKGVTDMTCAEDAIVPIISMMFDGIEIDLSFCALQRSHVPEQMNMMDNSVLVGLDEIMVRSVNGVRVAAMIPELVPKIAVFRQALRFIKVWAKRRGVYSAKLGFPSGVGWAILVARVCQYFPNQNGAGIVAGFFRFYSTWFRPDPVGEGRPNGPITLTPLEVKDPVPNMPKVFDPLTNHRDAQALFPIVTPAYPCQNACYNVSRTTLGTLCEEFRKGKDIIAAEMERLGEAFGNTTEADRPEGDYGVWTRLLEPYDFFNTFPYYLRVSVSCTSPMEYDKWIDFVEARMRFLWTESFHYKNIGAALESYKSVNLRVFTGRFEEPAQVEELNRVKAAEKARTAKSMTLGSSNVNSAAASPRGSLLAGSPAGAGLAASPQGNVSTPLKRMSAGPAGSPMGGSLAGAHLQGQGAAANGPVQCSFPILTAHFYFGITLTSGKDAKGKPLPQPNLKEIVPAFHNVLREKLTPGARLPTVDIVASAQLPSWLPGRSAEELAERSKAAAAAAAAEIAATEGDGTAVADATAAADSVAAGKRPREGDAGAVPTAPAAVRDTTAVSLNFAAAAAAPKPSVASQANAVPAPVGLSTVVPAVAAAPAPAPAPVVPAGPTAEELKQQEEMDELTGMDF